jgi:biotin carboxyl carrier protein
MIKTTPFQITINGNHQLEVMPDDANNLDLVTKDGRHFHILSEGRAFQAEVLEAAHTAHTYTIAVNGKKYVVKISDFYERLVDQLGFKIGSTSKINAVKAPMPGLVLSVLVEPGQAVQKGDSLLILEAMKMENVLKAAGEGVVKVIKARKGEAVEKGALLIEME